MIGTMVGSGATGAERANTRYIFVDSIIKVMENFSKPGPKWGQP